MKKIILALMVATSFSFSGSLFKAENDEKTHIAIGAMTSVWANLLAKKHGATDIQALLVGVGASIVVGYAASDGNTDMASDALGGAIGGAGSIVIWRFNSGS